MVHPDALDPESELVQALELLQASHRALHRSMGSEVIAIDWQPGQPVPGHLHQLRRAEADLRRLIHEVQAMVAERYR